MKTVLFDEIVKKVKATCLKAGCQMNKDAYDCLSKAYMEETLPATKFALDIMLKNANIARESNSPLCQDTGMAVVFAKVGQEVKIEGGYITDAINEGVRQAYSEGYFRKSVLDPITRQNTLDNTPAVIHYEIVKGEELKISVLLKGFGSENMSRLFMLTPSDGIEGIKQAVIRSVKEAGGNPCPPIIVGVGIGGTMEKAAIMSKHCLLRDIGSKNEDSLLDAMEEELKENINKLNIGAQGFGGKNTVFKVFIEKYPTHLAGLPVAVTLQCHASRHGEIVF